MANLITYATDTTTTGGRGTPNAISPGSDGNNWTNQTGNQTVSFSGTQILITYTNNTNPSVWTYSGQSQADQEVLVNITQQNANNAQAGAVLRCSDPTHFYYCIIGNTTGDIEIGKNVGGTFTQLTTAAFASTHDVKYSLRFQVVGTTLKGRIWDSSTTEPQNWTIQCTDNSLFTGFFGIWGAPTGSHSCFYDTFSATNGAFVDPNPLPASIGTEVVGLTAGALNADLLPAFDMSLYQTWSLQVGAIASGGTLTFAASNDGATFDTLTVNRISDGTAVSSTTATDIFFGTRNYRYLRVRQTAWGSGTSNATLQLYY